MTVKKLNYIQTGLGPAHLSKQKARTHTICYAAASPH